MKSNKAGEYIDKKKREDYPGGYLCYTLSEENAKKAVARTYMTEIVIYPKTAFANIGQA